MPGERALRRDAAANRERVLEAAVKVIAVEGMDVPLAEIAEQAGVGIATFYRSFPDREALLGELGRRAYASLIEVIGDLEEQGVRGLSAVEQFLVRSLDLADQMVLPLHGAPPLVDAQSAADRRSIDDGLQRFLDQAHEDGDCATDANATDVIMCSALLTQPLRHGPDWSRTARRHVALFVAGLSTDRELPGPPVRQVDLEDRWSSLARAAQSGDR